MPMFNYNNIDNIQICMDVPFLDHPYLIGPRGRKCQHLMDRYRSLIHFPDSNRRQNGPKLNNVIINGSSKNAEELRFQIRSRTPIRLALFLQNIPDADALCSRMESAIADRSLPIRLNYTEDYSSAMLKTEWRNEEALVNFCNEFIHVNSDRICNNFEDLDLFTMALTILPVVNPWNPDLSLHLIEHIHSVTGSQVFYPPKEKFADQPPSYFIKGSTAAGVLKAGKYMMGLTMFQVSFVVPSTVQLNLNNTMEWQRDLLVHTSIEPVFVTNDKNGGNSEFVHNRAVLRSFEFCLNSVYFVRSLLLGFKKTVQSSHYSFMNEMKKMIPCSVFSEGQLYFPLYAIDDERSFNFDTSGAEFFKRFYGGPYSLERYQKQCESAKMPPALQSMQVAIPPMPSQYNPEQTFMTLYGGHTSPQQNISGGFKDIKNEYDAPMFLAPPPPAYHQSPAGMVYYCNDENGYSFCNDESGYSFCNDGSGAYSFCNDASGGYSFYGNIDANNNSEGYYSVINTTGDSSMLNDTNLVTMMINNMGKAPYVPAMDNNNNDGYYGVVNTSDNSMVNDANLMMTMMINNGNGKPVTSGTSSKRKSASF